MGASDSRAWLVSYDIRRRKRLTKVHKWLLQHGVALQYSVFLGVWNEPELEAAWLGLRTRIRRSEDDVRAYALASHCRLDVRGAAALGRGIALRSKGLKLLRSLEGNRTEGEEDGGERADRG